LNWDLFILLALNHWIAHSTFAQLTEQILEDLPAILAPMAVVLWWLIRPVNEQLRTRALLLLIAQPITYALATILQREIPRPRPIVSVPLEYFNKEMFATAHAYFTNAGSFPSDHEALLFLLATFVFAVDRWAGIACALLGIFYATLRCGMGYHWPSDMVGGALLAMVIGGVLLYFEPWFAKLFRRLREPTRRCEPVLSVAVFAYLADQFNSFSYARTVVRVFFHGRLFH
jgi:membrane-associated phospholipid phosphatase